MKRTVVAICLSGFILGAETPAPKQELKLQPYQAAALANALRGSKAQASDRLLSYLDPRNSNSQSLPLLIAKTKTQSQELACAIPLLEAQADRAQDSKIRVPAQRNSSVADGMPRLKGLPVCRDTK